ncbi:hypothetical protein JP0042_12190 [Helicobacter pylori]|nr:hypothetical protein JP0042_12190 [Helicobacter pylori]
MMHYLYTSNQYDKAFIAKYTDGFDKFLPYLLGESDNVPKTLEWASQITGVSAEKIKELADLFVSKLTFLAGNWAMQRAQHGEQPDLGVNCFSQHDWSSGLIWWGLWLFYALWRKRSSKLRGKNCSDDFTRA